ncbi:unnamed protein product [Camellia sinensis]
MTSCPGADLFLLLITAVSIMMSEIVWRFQVIHSGSIIAGNFVLFYFILFCFCFFWRGRGQSNMCSPSEGTYVLATELTLVVELIAIQCNISLVC